MTTQIQDLKTKVISSSGDTCPKCGSDNIANEGPESEITCHDCSYQWDETQPEGFEPATLVVFRTFKNGDVIALFPELDNYLDSSCESYQHVGQHGAASYHHVMAVTRASTPEEIAPLKRELESIGYRLEIRKRYNPRKVA